MSWSAIFSELQTVALEADQRRLSVFVDQFAMEYPEIYGLIYDLADVSPDKALQSLCERWPALMSVKFHPQHQQIISALQAEIQKRKAQST